MDDPRRTELEEADVVRLRSLRALGDLELDLLALFEGAEAPGALIDE
jgi:hypothetical protein